jgi:hypothetical protein
MLGGWVRRRARQFATRTGETYSGSIDLDLSGPRGRQPSSFPSMGCHPQIDLSQPNDPPKSDVTEKLERRQTPQTIAWFRDLHTRDLLDLDPPYQRRSVWNQMIRVCFIETVLPHYAAPPIYVHEDIGPDGRTKCAVVDGRQRLTTVFDFADDLFPVADDSLLLRYQGQFFSHLDDDAQKTFGPISSQSSSCLPISWAIDGGLCPSVSARF